MKVYVNVEIGEDGDGYPSIYKIYDVTKSPKFRISQDFTKEITIYGETKNISIENNF